MISGRSNTIVSADTQFFVGGSIATNVFLMQAFLRDVSTNPWQIASLASIGVALPVLATVIILEAVEQGRTPDIPDLDAIFVVGVIATGLALLFAFAYVTTVAALAFGVGAAIGGWVFWTWFNADLPKPPPDPRVPPRLSTAPRPRGGRASGRRPRPSSDSDRSV